MKRSDNINDDQIQKWVDSLPGDKAPEGFTHNVMVRVEVEPVTNLSRYNSPISPKFRIASIVGFGILLLISLLSANGEYASSFNIPFIDRIGDLSFPSIEIPELDFSRFIDLRYIFMGASVLVLLSLLDYTLNRLHSYANKK